MELILETSKKSSVNVPKLTAPTFEMKNNYYVVADGSTFNYFSIKVFESDENHPLIRFEKSPPVLLEGLAVVNKRVYKVTLKDLQRQVIRKSRDITKEVIDASANRNTGTKSEPAATVADTNSSQAVSDKLEQRADQEAEVEVNQAADAAWQDQIGALLTLMSEKEGDEWEIAEAP